MLRSMKGWASLSVLWFFLYRTDPISELHSFKFGGPPDCIPKTPYKKVEDEGEKKHRQLLILSSPQFDREGSDLFPPPDWADSLDVGLQGGTRGFGPGGWNGAVAARVR